MNSRAALRIQHKEAVNAMQEELDTQLAIAIRRRLGLVDDEPVESHLKGRLFDVVAATGLRGVFYRFDGQPLLWADEVRVVDGGNIYHLTRRLTAVLLIREARNLFAR